MARESGNLSIHTENIFPIIKKWLYSDKDIFLRELVSNSCDAISKFKRLVSVGEAEADSGTAYAIKVVVDRDKKTMQVIDNGIGMTEEEVRKYINTIAFSGAQDFIEKYRDKTDDAQIIGHFGLGFYSAFMVADRIQIDTLSFEKGAKAVKWIGEGSGEFEMDDSDRTERGTTVTLHMLDDSLDFLEEHKAREILNKYCYFLPFEIFLEDVTPDRKKDKEKDKDGGGPKPLNDTHPLWLKNPKDCTDDEYKEFYHKVFLDFNDPLFWIHLNMEYPFNLKGILFFPKLKHEFETIEGQIKLYYNQVFVADNIKEVIPEFLMLLKGTLDCPDLPLNVSRSFLQNDGYIAKISSHITKKVADKLISVFENERENYNRYWDDINPFVKYGCMREPKFFEKVKDIVIYRTIGGDYVTLKDYLERNKLKHENKVFYVTDEKQQAQYIKMFKDNGMDAIVLSTMIDSHFITFLEMQEKSVKFSRIDSDISESLKEAGDKSSQAFSKEVGESLEKLFKEALANEKLKIHVENLKSASVPAVIQLDEHSRRWQEMSRMFGGADMKNLYPEEQTLVLNRKNPVIQALLRLKDREEKKEDVRLICEQVYDLAAMSHKQLDPPEMTRFIERSATLLEKLAGINML